MSQQTRTILILTMLAAAQVATADFAFAQAGGSAFGPIERAMQMVIDFVNGPFGRSAGVIAVMGVGLMALAGRISWLLCLMVVIGMGLLFGAPQIVDQLAGGTR